MKTASFVPNPALVSLLGLAPLVGATTNFASGCVVGIVMGVGALVASGSSSFPRSGIGGRLAFAAQLALMALYASLCWLLLEAWSPALAADIGIYLPLIAVSSLVVHEMKRVGKTGDSWWKASLVSALQYLAVAILVSAIREIAGGGTLTLPFPGYVPSSYSLFDKAPLPIFLSPAGAFFTLAFLAILDRFLFSPHRFKDVTR